MARHRWLMAISGVLLAGLMIPGANPAAEPTGTEAALALQATFTRAIERAEVSVVSIARMKFSDQTGAMLRLRAGQLGGNLDLNRSEGPDNPDFVPNDFGSGVVIGEEGLILTNYHVVQGGDKLFVRVHDGKGYTATIYAADPHSDLAVLKLRGEDGLGGIHLQPIALGDASTVRKGHLVLLLGNSWAAARDGSASASWGIVSNIARRLAPPSDPNEQRTVHHFGTLIQTDARLNVGMSGGAVINLAGEMIGLTTALANVSGYDASAGYAVPIDGPTRRIIETLRAGKEVEYGFLGVRLSQQGNAVRAEEVKPGTPAYEAGVRAGDLIQAINDRPIRDRDDLMLVVGYYPVGAKVKLTVQRPSSGQVELSAVLAKFPVAGKIIATHQPAPWRGARVDYLTTLFKSGFMDFEMSQALEEGGVVVSEVEESSPAYDAQLKQGQIIHRVDGQPIRTPREFYERVRPLKGPVKLQTDQGEITVN